MPVGEMQLLDFDARDRIRKSLRENLIVEAAAGTGKTTELVRRIVAVLQTGLAQVDRIVAVTFTRKAAGELKLRLRQELDEARSFTSRASERKNLEKALAQLEEARIGTIHAFCADLLRERPVEACVDPAFEELSEDQAARLYDQAFGAWVQEKLQEMPPGLRRAFSRTAAAAFPERSPVEGLGAAGWRLTEWRDLSRPWKRKPFAREPVTDDLVGQVMELATMSQLCRSRRDSLWKHLEPARSLATWIRRAEAVHSRDYDGLEARLMALLRELGRSKQGKGRGLFGEGISREDVWEARNRLFEELQSFQRQADADLAALVQGELQELADRYEQLKVRSGRLDFVDLLVRVRDLLRGNVEVRAYLQQRLTHIFVDEFQDTDPLQVEVLLLLSADDPSETDWRRVRPGPGKLFLVGDPKQSIYRFRRADVLLYQQVKQLLTARGVGLVYLTTSFRAVDNIQNFVNAAFEPEMREDPIRGQSEYVPLRLDPQEAARGAAALQPSVVALPVPAPYGVFDISKIAVENCLPQAVAAFIDWLLKKSGWAVRDPENPDQNVALESRHVCVLFRRFIAFGRDITRDYVRELEVRDIPHLLVGGKSFHRREEVETLRAALTAIEWPDDELSVFATLKGSLFAIPDSVLLRFRSRYESLYVFRRLPEDLEEEFVPVREALGLLADLHRRRNRRAIVETVNELLESTRSHAGFALRPAGDQALANLQRICDLARNFETAGGISFRGFVEQLMAEAQKTESAEAPLLEEGAEGVRLMTVHVAKGLEFPVVILADITAPLSHRQPDKYVDADAGLCALRILGCSPWDLVEHEEEEKAREEAEGVRIAYVAATRARDLLVVPAIGDKFKDGWWLDPLNKALYPPAEYRRQAEKAAACPAFGQATVLQRPVSFDGVEEFSVLPGLHRLGQHQVVWWDPGVLDLEVPETFGLRQERILVEDQGKASEEGLLAYQVWREQRRQALERGSRPRFDVSVVSKMDEAPPTVAWTVKLQKLAKEAGRPSGSRFGTLVHTVLRDVDLQADRTRVRQLAELQGRVLGAPEAEVEAAVKVVAGVLEHPLLERARQAERVHRELPVVVPLEQGERMVEGTIDLAFLKDGEWTVVDFKTDADLEANRLRYERQIGWYVYALRQVVEGPVQPWLLDV